MLRLISQWFGPGGWVPPGPRWAFPSRRKSGAGLFCPYTAEHETHRPILCLIILCKFATMGVAQVTCCVGGMLSCIGARGGGALRALPFCSCVSQEYSTPFRQNTQEIFSTYHYFFNLSPGCFKIKAVWKDRGTAYFSTCRRHDVKIGTYTVNVK